MANPTRPFSMGMPSTWVSILTFGVGAGAAALWLGPMGKKLASVQLVSVKKGRDGVAREAMFLPLRRGGAGDGIRTRDVLLGKQALYR